MVIIAIGSFKSLEEMLRQMKQIHITKDGKKTGNIEKMDFSDAWQFPIVAGCTLCGLYFAMDYFGKDVVNYFLMVYIAIGGVAGIRSILQAIFGDVFGAYDKQYLIDIVISKIGLEAQLTLFDLLCLVISSIQMGLYIYFKNWIYNNCLALIFCINAL